MKSALVAFSAVALQVAALSNGTPMRRQTMDHLSEISDRDATAGAVRHRFHEVCAGPQAGASDPAQPTFAGP